MKNEIRLCQKSTETKKEVVSSVAETIETRDRVEKVNKRRTDEIRKLRGFNRRKQISKRTKLSNCTAITENSKRKVS